MSVSLVSKLRQSALDGGVETDELYLSHSGASFTLIVAGKTHEGLSEGELEDVLSAYDDHLREWKFWHQTAPQSSWQWAFLRWLEDADDRSAPDRRHKLEDGVATEWGQLLVQVRLVDGRRRYELRHVDDADRDHHALRTYSDPVDARQLAKYDDDGRYRPLSTAPSLQTGWVFPQLRPTELVQAVDFFYPATIPNWYRERAETLDVTHWADATQRQTGIYEVTSELTGRAVDWVAEACCVDSQCLKRREWDERADRPLTVPRGTGAFPCREPCSVVIAAARKWARLEREDERTYVLRLTPSEKEQIEELLSAVAEGRVNEIREADVDEGANRYRARYLRAKRTDERGCLVTTDDTDD